MRFLGTVKDYLKDYKITDEDARRILEDVEKEVGHNPNLIKAMIDYEKHGLIRRLKRKRKESEIAYV